MAALNFLPEPHGHGSLRPTFAPPNRASSDGSASTGVAGRRSRGPSGLPPGRGPGRGRGSGRARPARASRGPRRVSLDEPQVGQEHPAFLRRQAVGVRRDVDPRRRDEREAVPAARAPRHPGRRQAASRRPVSRRRWRRAPPSRERAPPGATPPIPSDQGPCPQVTPARPCAPPTPRGPARRGSAAGRGRRRAAAKRGDPLVQPLAGDPEAAGRRGLRPARRDQGLDDRERALVQARLDALAGEDVARDPAERPQLGAMPDRRQGRGGDEARALRHGERVAHLPRLGPRACRSRPPSRRA